MLDCHHFMVIESPVKTVEYGKWFTGAFNLFDYKTLFHSIQKVFFGHVFR